jgi:hypothetical protein
MARKLPPRSSYDTTAGMAGGAKESTNFYNDPSSGFSGGVQPRTKANDFLWDLAGRTPTPNADALNLKLQIGRMERQRQREMEGLSMRDSLEKDRGRRKPGAFGALSSPFTTLPFGPLGGGAKTLLGV